MSSWNNGAPYFEREFSVAVNHLKIGTVRGDEPSSMRSSRERDEYVEISENGDRSNVSDRNRGPQPTESIKESIDLLPQRRRSAASRTSAIAI